MPHRGGRGSLVPLYGRVDDLEEKDYAIFLSPLVSSAAWASAAQPRKERESVATAFMVRAVYEAKRRRRQGPSLGQAGQKKDGRLARPRKFDSRLA